MPFADRCLPTLCTSNWWNAWDYPKSIYDQHFGMDLLDCDLYPPTIYEGYCLRPRTKTAVQASGTSEVINEKDKLKIKLSVKQFKPEEIEVKVVDDFIVVHAKHEEKSDEHGSTQREFTRRYMLPEKTNKQKITSTLNIDGILIVEAPKKIELSQSNEITIPVEIQKFGASSE